MSTPDIQEGPGCYKFTWAEEQIQIQVSRLAQEKGGVVRGTIRATTSAPGYHPHLTQTQFNFSSSRTRNELAKDLIEQYNGADWRAVLEQLCFHTLERMWKGEPDVEIDTDNSYPPPEYLLHPVIPKDQPTVFFGLGGTGKSTLAMVFGVCVQMAWQANPFALSTFEEPVNVLYLDYETAEREIGWRLKCFQRGMEAGRLKLRYRRCVLPLADDVEQLQQLIFERNTGFVIVDSIAGACGADLNNAETAIRMFAALRQLKVTSLLIAHTTKNASVKEATPFGSAFFSNFARSTWEVRKHQEEGSTTLHVGLHHRKSNISELVLPLGFRISRDNVQDSLYVAREEVREEAAKVSNNGAVTLEMALSMLLGDGEEFTCKELEPLTGHSEASIRTTLNRMAKADMPKVAMHGGKWIRIPF